MNCKGKDKNVKPYFSLNDVMCRLFSIISANKASLYEDVFTAKYSILKQSIEEEHNDGWGIYAYKDSTLQTLAKSTARLNESKEYAAAVTKSINANLSGFFIRSASNPLGLDRAKIMTVEATQPFEYKNIVFMHNGAVRAPDKIMKEAYSSGMLPKASYSFGMLPRSMNDSEVYFILFVKYFLESGDAAKAFVLAEKFITETYAASVGGDESAFTSLNTIVSDGKKLYAFNKYTSKFSKSVSDPDREFYKMCFFANNSLLKISSEPTTDGEWNEMGDGKMLEAWIENGAIRYSIKSLK